MAKNALKKTNVAPQPKVDTDVNPASDTTTSTEAPETEGTPEPTTQPVADAQAQALPALNVYRAYVLDYRKPLEPVTTIYYVRAVKYGAAWRIVTALLGKSDPNPADGIAKLFDDEGCTVENVDYPRGDAVKIATATDLKGRNVKMDASKLKELLTDDSLSPEDKLRRAAEGLGLKLPA